MRSFIITPPFALPLYILPTGLWLLDWFYLDPYFEAVSKLPTHTDGQSIALSLGQVGSIPVLPFIVLILFLILKPYPGCVSLWVWNSQKPSLSIFWTALFLSLSFVSITEAQRMLSLSLWLNALVYLVWVYLFLTFRSIVVAKTKGIAIVLSSTDPEYLVCPQCKLEQWRGYGECQRCGRHIT
jgi:hypothetical protein